MQSQYSSQYTYCYDQQEPDSLVMLSPIEHIISYMFQPVENQFIWFDYSALTSPLELLISKMEKQLDIRISYFNDTDEMDRYFAESQKKCFVFISSHPGLASVEHVGKKYKKQVKGGIIFPFSQQYAQTLNQREYFHEDQSQNTISYQELFLQAPNEKKLQQLVLIYRKKESLYQILPNFIHLTDNIFNSNVIVMSMHCMLKQKINIKTRQKLVVELKKLLNKIAEINTELRIEQEVLVKFLIELSQNSLSKERAIFWYTQQSVIYKIVNNLFRSAKHPTELFYIQPFFKDLFYAIFELQNNKNKKKQLQQEFVCYRGGQATEDEIKGLMQNVGEMVQNLGFLSTSLSQEIAKIYVKNVVFEIVVKDPKTNKQNFGYAWIAEHSYYFEEQQIIFNPLNSFKILEITTKQVKDKEVYYIKLKFGQLGILASKNKKFMSNKQKLYRQINRMQEQRGGWVRNQGSILTNKAFNLKGAIQYWRKYISICKVGFNKCTGLSFATLSEINMGNYGKALTYLNLQKQVLEKSIIQISSEDVLNFSRNNLLESLSVDKVRTILQQKQTWHEKIKNYDEKKLRRVMLYLLNMLRTGLVYQHQGFFEQAFEQYLKSLNFHLLLVGLKEQYLVGILNNIASCFQAMMRLDESLQFYEICKEVGREIFGEYSESYISIISNMANLYTQKKFYQKAVKIHQNCVEVQLKVLGNNHPHYASSLVNLATLYKQIGKFSQALKICKQILEITEKNKLYCRNIFNINQPLNLMGLIYVKSGNLKEALKFFKKCLDEKGIPVGGNQISNILILVNISYVYFQMFQFQLSIKQYEIIRYRLLKKIERNQLYFQIQVSLSILYYCLGDYQKLLKLVRAIIISQQKKGWSEIFEKSLWYLASIYQRIKQFQSMRATFSKISKAREKYGRLDYFYKISKRNALKVKIKIKERKKKKRYISYVQFL